MAIMVSTRRIGNPAPKKHPMNYRDHQVTKVSSNRAGNPALGNAPYRTGSLTLIGVLDIWIYVTILMIKYEYVMMGQPPETVHKPMR